MRYRRSVALDRWLTDRAASIRCVAEAHVLMGEVYGRGRPLEIGRPLAHAYVLRMVAEFQGFTCDLHELAAEHLVVMAGLSTRPCGRIRRNMFGWSSTSKAMIPRRSC